MSKVHVCVWTLLVVLGWYLSGVADSLDIICDPLTEVHCQCSVIGGQVVITCKDNSKFSGTFPDLSHISNNTTIILKISTRPVTHLPRELFEQHPNLSTLHLQNTGLRTIEKGLLQGLPVQSRTLRLDKNELSTIPDDAFADNDIQELDISYNQFSDVPLAALKRARKINKLIMDGNPIGRDSKSGGLGVLKKDAFLDLKDLSALSLSNCGIRRIENDAFKGLIRLNTLHLDNNQLQTIGSGYFFNLTRDGNTHQNALQTLYLNNNQIREIEPGVFNQSSGLKSIYLDHNKIRVLRKGVLRSMVLKELTLAHNELMEFERGAFDGVQLTEGMFDLSFNSLTEVKEYFFTGLVLMKSVSSPPHGPILRMDFCRIEQIEDNALNITNLQDLKMRYNRVENLTSAMFGGVVRNMLALEMDNNRLKEVPRLQSPNLKTLKLNHNHIRTVGEDDFKVYRKLFRLELRNNSQLSYIHPHALRGLTKLELIELDSCHLSELPSFEGLKAIRDISVSGNQLTEFPSEICNHCPDLTYLLLSGNHLSRVPDFANCSFLGVLHIHDNPIGNMPNNVLERNYELTDLVLRNISMSKLPPNLLKYKRKLGRLDVQENQITRIPTRFFAESFELRNLYLSHNHLVEIQKGVFQNLTYLDTLSISNNNLKVIDEEAWLNYTFHYLTHLDLSHNVELSHLPTPGDGFPHLENLLLANCPKLEKVPPPEKTTRLVLARYTYGYHCCLWKANFPDSWQSKENVPKWFDDIERKNYGILETIPTPSTEPPTSLPTSVISTTFGLSFEDIVEQLKKEYGAKEDTNSSFFATPPTTERPTRIHPANSLIDFACYPRITPFTPCEDLMGSWPLRVCVWAVVILAIFGNAAVLFVLVASRKSMDVPQFLVCNLAFGDLCLGVYLAFISVVDLQTQGTNRFYLSAIPWQNGPGCKTAGFFAIFATELSVYCLVLITFERLYTISNVMTRKHIGIKMAILLVSIGWVLSCVFALLPLLDQGINSYSSVCVCLPFEFQGLGDKIYLGMLVSVNLLALVLIVAFYIRIYWLTRKTQAANSGSSDRKLIRSILMLTVVDFMCWVPLSIITLAAIGGHEEIIDTSASKWFVVLVFPINACANPFLYAIFTKKFREHVKSLVCCSNKHNFLLHRQRLSSRDHQRPQYAERRASISIAEYHRRLSTSSLEMSSQQRARSNSIQPLLTHYSGNTSVMSNSDHTSMTSVGSSIFPHGRRSSLPSTLLATPSQRDCPHLSSMPQDSDIQYLTGVYTHLVPPISICKSGSLPNLADEDSTLPVALAHRTLSPSDHHPQLATLVEASNENIQLTVSDVFGGPSTPDGIFPPAQDVVDPLTPSELRSFSKSVFGQVNASHSTGLVEGEGESTSLVEVHREHGQLTPLQPPPKHFSSQSSGLGPVSEPSIVKEVSSDDVRDAHEVTSPSAKCVDVTTSTAQDSIDSASTDLLVHDLSNGMNGDMEVDVVSGYHSNVVAFLKGNPYATLTAEMAEIETEV